MSKDTCPECENGLITVYPNDREVQPYEDTCPTCNGTGEKQLDSPREKICGLRILPNCCGCFPNDDGICEEIAKLLALLPDIEELEKQVRQLKESDFAEIPYASDFRKVQLDGGQFVYENILRLIRKMEGKSER